uniref:Uncharacterized protein n=1 Tax=Vitrella brassicaformis TaxID=1169539 RepID=A0A6U4DUP4_9ALVE
MSAAAVLHRGRHNQPPDLPHLHAQQRLPTPLRHAVVNALIHLAIARPRAVVEALAVALPHEVVYADGLVECRRLAITALNDAVADTGWQLDEAVGILTLDVGE